MPYCLFEGAYIWVGPAGAEVAYWRDKYFEERKKNISSCIDSQAASTLSEVLGTKESSTPASSSPDSSGTGASVPGLDTPTPGNSGRKRGANRKSSGRGRRRKLKRRSLAPEVSEPTKPKESSS